MSEKRYDNCNRWRNKIVAFRMSPEEAEGMACCNKHVAFSARNLGKDGISYDNF